MTKFIVIASSKGGVGKTTTAINLGTALTLFGKDVVVVDCNMNTPNVSLYLGAASVPVTLHDVLNKNKKITDAMYMHSHGLKIIPASNSIKEKGKIDYERLTRILKDLSGKADYIIIDSSAGIGEGAITSMKMADELLVVSTPELPAVADALKTMKLAKEYNKKVRGVILTRAYEDELELSRSDVEAMLETKVIAIIPEDETMREAVKMKNPVMHTHPNSPASLGYKKLASELIGEQYVESIEKDESGFDMFMKKIGLK